MLNILNAPHKFKMLLQGNILSKHWIQNTKTKQTKQIHMFKIYTPTHKYIYIKIVLFGKPCGDK